MTKLVILSPSERKRFDAPPKFNADDRALYFSLSNHELKLIEELRSVANKIGFILQLGYFKANGKFFTIEQFRRPDIDYVVNLLGILPVNAGLSSYKQRIAIDHRKRNEPPRGKPRGIRRGAIEHSADYVPGFLHIFLQQPNYLSHQL